MARVDLDIPYALGSKLRAVNMCANVKKRFSWKLVFVLAPIGLVFAALTILGLLPGVKSTQWTALALLAVVGVIVARRAPTRPFLHGLAAGFVVALVAVEVQALFLDIYFANNPQYADLEIPFGLPPRLATAVLGPVNAVFAGVISGIVAWLGSMVMAKSGPQG